MMSEKLFREWLKERFTVKRLRAAADEISNKASGRAWFNHGTVWLNTNEAAYGGSVGTTDMWFLIPGTTQFVPVELKIAEIIPAKGSTLPAYDLRGSGHDLVDGDLDYDKLLLRPRFIRGTQIAWHERLHQAGARSCFAFAGSIPSTEVRWNVWVLSTCNHDTLKGWKYGIPFDQLTRVATNDKFHYWAWWHALQGDKP